MKHEVKIGDLFKLHHLTLEVAHIYENGDLRAARVEESAHHEEYGGLLFFKQELDQLEWIELEVTFTKEQAAALKAEVGELLDGGSVWVWLDSHTEK